MAEPHPIAGFEEAEEDPLVGRVLEERYSVVACIGAGGMGRVYRAVQLPLEREVALKVLQLGPAADKRLVERFFREAAITARLSHPHIVTLFDYGRTDDGLLFIAMEHLRGRTLGALLQKERALPPRRALAIARQIARALRDAHREGLVHRDLKPSNVMLVSRDDEPDFVKLLDFGLARFSDPEIDRSQSGLFAGSPHYMAPEQARNEPPTPRADVYSLGVLLYRMVTGHLPFDAGSSIAVLLEHARGEPKPPRLHDPSLPPALDAAILRMLQKDPAQRTDSMDAVLRDLDLADDAIVERAPGPAPGGRVTLVLAAAAALLAAAAVVLTQL